MSWRGRGGGREEPAKPGGLEFGPSRRRPSFPAAVQLVGGLLGILATGFVLAPQVGALFDHGGTPALEIAEVAVSNPPAALTSVGNGETGQEPASEPTVSATVRNRGSETAWIDEARITIAAATRMAVCLTQGAGDVPTTRRYPDYLPDFPGAEPRTMTRALHVEVQPGHGVRPVLGFRKSTYLDATNLYAIHVQLIADPGHHVLDAGRFVIGVPGAVDRSGSLLPESSAALRSPATVPGDPIATACFRHNLAGMRRVIAQPGRRSDYLAALAHLRVASAWRAFAGHRPPRVVVPGLLGSELPEAPLYAVDTARRTGDPHYVATVERRAMSVLLAEGRAQLHGFPPAAMQAAERALSLDPENAAARHLLWQAKARGSS